LILRSVLPDKYSACKFHLSLVLKELKWDIRQTFGGYFEPSCTKNFLLAYVSCTGGVSL
jgi:hypothetical protein